MEQQFFRFFVEMATGALVGYMESSAQQFAGMNNLIASICPSATETLRSISDEVSEKAEALITEIETAKENLLATFSAEQIQVAAA